MPSQISAPIVLQQALKKSKLKLYGPRLLSPAQLQTIALISSQENGASNQLLSSLLICLKSTLSIWGRET